MLAMNHGESSIPKINEGTKARYAELMEQWKPLQAEGKRLIETAVPAFNKLATEKDKIIDMFDKIIVYKQNSMKQVINKTHLFIKFWQLH